MEIDEFKRLHEEKLQESLDPVGENKVPQYEWDGIRRRRTGTFSTHGARSVASTAHSTFLAPPTPTPHPPLGWSHMPTEEELAEANRPVSPALSNFVGTIRNRARSVLLPGHPDFRGAPNPPKVQSPMHPVHLTSIAVPGPKTSEEYDPGQEYNARDASDVGRRRGNSTAGTNRRVQFGGERRNLSNGSDPTSMHSPPTPPPHSARRQFSFQNIFKRHQSHAEGIHSTEGRPGGSSRGYSNPQMKGASEEERLGLVRGDSSSTQPMPALPRFDDSDDEDETEYADDKKSQYGHSITEGYRYSPPRTTGLNEKELDEAEVAAYRQRRQRFQDRGRNGTGDSDDDRPPPPPPHGGAFV